MNVRIIPRRPPALYRQAAWCWLARLAPAGKLPKGHTLRSEAARFHLGKDTVTKMLRLLPTVNHAALPPWLAVRDHTTTTGKH